MAARRTAVIVGARVIGAAVAIAVGVSAVAAAALVTWPTSFVSPVADRVVPVPTAAQRVCPGPLLTLAQDSAAATAVSSLGSPEVTAISGAGQADPESTVLTSPDDPQAGDDGAARVLRVEAGDKGAPLVAGSQSQVAATETDAGLAAGACVEAGSDSWLVGGSTDIGRTSLVLLTNPSAVPATVDLALYGESGPIEAPGSTGILVQPGTQKIISLAGLAPDVLAPVVHVSSTGGDIAAALQSSIVRGLEPGGIDVVGPTAAPATEVDIAGVVVAAAAGADAGDSDAAPGDDKAALRLLAPGSGATNATVSVTGENGAPGTSFSVHLEPGVAVDAPLAALPAGAYTVRVRADEPVVAAARTAVQGADGRDIAWFAASVPLGRADTVLAVADGPSPSLHLWNTGSTDVAVTLSGPKGDIDVAVPAASAVAVPVTAGTGYGVSGAGGLIASVSYTSTSQLASFTLLPPGPLAAPITVYTR